jgi:hypothetical protein
LKGEPGKVAGDYEFPFLTDERYNKVIQKFMYSFKNIYSENINARNLMFFTGETKAGKSWLLRYNIRKFQASSQNPIVFHYDMKELGMQSFEMFLYSFEKMLIDTLVERNQQELQTKKKPLISL